MPRVVIPDTSCLIVFDNIDGFNILREVYKDILTTPEVLNEYGVALPKFIKVVSVKNKKYQNFIETQLDIGESSAIALAAEIKNSLLILDDLRARKIAGQLGFNITGSLGIINKAKKMGVINKVEPYIKKLIDSGFYISEKVINELLRKK